MAVIVLDPPGASASSYTYKVPLLVVLLLLMLPSKSFTSQDWNYTLTAAHTATRPTEPT